MYGIRVILASRVLGRAAEIKIPTRSVSEGPPLAHASGCDGNLSTAARLGHGDSQACTNTVGDFDGLYRPT